VKLGSGYLPIAVAGRFTLGVRVGQSTYGALMQNACFPLLHPVFQDALSLEQRKPFGSAPLPSAPGDMEGALRDSTVR
jgi:hypothetical protein